MDAGIAVNEIRAAEYIRMSTDDQRYSPENQSDVNQAYAVNRRMTIVQTYYDRGRSGLNFERRDALRQLIEDVLARQADFTAIIVYDVSRWGRFQDPDESAYYEFVCKRAGIAVHYSAEQFNNDGSAISTIVKGLKRAMAAEFSRELSVKVFAGQSRLARKGYKLGGAPGYGLRRLLLDQNGSPKGTLEAGEFKCITTDRVVLVPGPPEETAVVRFVFSQFVLERKTERQIAAILNHQGLTNGLGRPWRHNFVGRMLRNEKYIGNHVWNRSSFKLQMVRLDNEPASWIRVEGAFPAVVERPMFDAAQEIFRTRGRFSSGGRPMELSEEQMLDALKALWRQHGYLSRELMTGNGRTPSAEAYARRFNGLKRLYELIGFRQLRRKWITRNGRPRGLSDEEMLDALRQLWRERGYLTQKIMLESKSVPCLNAYYMRFGSISRAYELIGFRHDPKRFPPRRIRRNESDDVLLEKLRELLRKHGRLSKAIIDKSRDVPCHGTIERRFGGLLRLYERLGYAPDQYHVRAARLRDLSRQELLNQLRGLLNARGYLSEKLVVATKSMPSTRTYRRHFGTMLAAYRLIGYTRGDRASIK